jgi:hypothetical protein
LAAQSAVATSAHEKAPASAVIAGSVIGAVAVLVIATLTAFFLFRRRQEQARRKEVLTPWIEPSDIGSESNSNVGRNKGALPFAFSYHDLPSMHNTETMVSPVTMSSEVDSDGILQPITARLEFLQNGMSWVVEFLQNRMAWVTERMPQHEGHRDYGGDSTTEKSDVPPPAYVFEQDL